MQLIHHLLIPEWTDQHLICGFTTPHYGNQALTRKCHTKGQTLRDTRELLLNDLKLKADQIFAPHQVHGCEVIEVKNSMKGAGCFDLDHTMDGDACFTSVKGILLMVTWADCTPILLYDPVNLHIAAIHAGWKSTAQNIVSKTIESFILKGSKIGQLYAAIGPSIRDCCYSVGNEFRNHFKHHLYERNDTLYFDLSGYHYEELLSAGIPEKQIDFYGKCTSCSRSPEFFSCRKDGKEHFEGQAAFIYLQESGSL